MVVDRLQSLIHVAGCWVATFMLALGCAPSPRPGHTGEREARDSIALFMTETVNDAALALRDDTIGTLEHSLLVDLQAASVSIDAALYSLNRETIIEALLYASARGVAVRIVTECENRYGAYREAFERLVAHGIDVVDDRSSYGGVDPECPDADGGSMHHKFFVIDSSIVWMGSTNMTWTGLNYNENHALRIASATIVEAYESEFEDLYAGLFGRNKVGGGIEFHSVQGAEIATAFSPRHQGAQSDSRQLVLDAVAAAKTSIRFALFYFTDSEVQQALTAKRSITEGVMDAVGASYTTSAHRALCAQGVPVTIENFPGKLHHKLGIFDAQGAGATPAGAGVIAGSANWTESGFAYNDESVILVYDRAIAARALKEYQALERDPVNIGLSCCDHPAEGFNAHSARCGETACVCSDASDNDFDGHADAADGDCDAAFVCGR